MIRTFYTNAKKLLLSGGLDLDANIYLALCDSSYVPNITTHTVYTDLTHEIVGAGYTAGGIALAGLVATADNVNYEGMLDATDPQWLGLMAANVQYIVFYQSTGSKYLIGYIDLESPATYAPKNVSVVFHADGLIRVQ